MRGGEYIGRGAYGCVFKPALKCADTTYVPDSIGKVYFPHQDGYRQEALLARKLDKIDPDQKYMIYPRQPSASGESCFVKKKDVVKEDPSNQCKFGTIRKHRSFHQLVMPYGGLSLNKYLRSLQYKLSRKDALLLVSNALLGVKLLIENKYLHQDIKLDNVVVDENGVSRLIDFGMLIKTKEFSKHFFNDVEYFLTSPEYRIVKYKKNFEGLVDVLQKNLKTFAKLDAWKEDGVDIVDASYVDELRKYHHEVVAAKPPTQNPGKADIYSFGIMIMEMHRYLIPANQDDPQAVQKFNSLLYGMLRPTPDTRLDIDTILSKVKELTSANIESPKIQNKDSRIIQLPVVTGHSRQSPPVVETRVSKVLVQHEKKKECPPGKVLNPRTNRCIKDKGKKNAAAEANVPHLEKKKECPPGKVLNPKTNRCIKDKAAAEVQPEKKCPPGKVLNPKTNRCVNENGKIGMKLRK